MSVNMPTTVAVQVDGAQTAGAGKVSVAAPFAGKIVSASAALGTAPTAADFIIDVNIAGASVFAVAGDRLTIAATTQTGTAGVTATGDVTDFAAGDLITLDVDQIGATIAGSDLTVCLVLDADLNPTD